MPYKSPSKKEEYMREYYQKNKDKRNKQMREYREKNRKKLIKHSREYYQKNKDKYKKYLVGGREYYQKNKEKINKRIREYNQKNRKKIIKQSREYHQKNRKRIREYNQKRRQQDPILRIKLNLRSRLRVCLKNYGEGKKFPSSKYGINYKKIIEHLKPFPKEIKKYHIDHIKPLCSFDLTNPKQIKNAFAPENHQWLLAGENLKKGGRY